MLYEDDDPAQGTPDAGLWTEVKTRSAARPATVTITGFNDPSMQQVVSRGRVAFRTSRDPVGAPIFYRDVPLMPTEGEQGTIKPLPQQAIGLIKWRLRNVGEPQSRTIMENLPTCANCHSFSLDGKTLGLDVDGPQNDKGLYALVPVQKEMVIRNEDVIKWSALGARLGGKLRAAFSSQVSPDGRYVVTTIEDPRAKISVGAAISWTSTTPPISRTTGSFRCSTPHAGSWPGTASRPVRSSR